MSILPCAVRTDPQGRELIRHGTALFPAACYHDRLDLAPVPWHWHDEWEAAVLWRGAALVAVEGEKRVLRRGEGFFINAGVLHAAWDHAGSACQFHSVVFHPRLVGGGVDSVFWQKYVQPLLEGGAPRGVFLDRSARWHREALEAVEAAWQACGSEQPGYEFSVRAALSRLVLQLERYPRPSAEPPPTEKALRDGERIRTMIQFIQAHCGEELTAAQIAASAAVSESECLRCFRAAIGVPPMQYLRQLRLQKAAELLQTTQLRIADVGARCGFQDASYFTKTFREWKGCSPGAYRRKKGGT